MLRNFNLSGLALIAAAYAGLIALGAVARAGSLQLALFG